MCSILHDVFALLEVGASTIMLTTHTTGRAVISRFAATAARAKIGEMRALAQTFPLWIEIEPA